MTDTSQVYSIQIKGVREGLLATLGDGPWDELMEALLSQVSEGGSFFHGARLAVDTGGRSLKAVDLGRLRDCLADLNVTLWAVISSSSTTEQTARVLGLATRLAPPRPERIIRPIETNLTGEGAMLVQRTLRSGYRVVSPGHLVIIGDVNPGAEIIAKGSVVVWGRLKGSAHAGSDGDNEAVVCALEVEPTILRIANEIGGIQKKRGKPQPAICRIMNGQIIIEPWNPKGR